MSSVSSTNGDQQNYKVALSYHGTKKWVLVYANMPRDELYDTVCAAFNLEDLDIAGLRSESGVSFPLSLVAKAPSYFVNGTFAVVGTAATVAVPPSAPQAPAPVAPVVPIAPAVPVVEGTVVSEPVSFSLESIGVGTLMKAFDGKVQDGMLDRQSFTEVFELLVEGETIPTQKSAAQYLGSLFDAFDHNKVGKVDAGEFISGCIMLAGGDHEDKIRNAFRMFDLDGSGYISHDEMRRYLRSLFVVIGRQKPEVFEAHQVDPVDLADATAEQCFLEADLNHDGRLSYGEFRLWYQSAKVAGISASNPTEDAGGAGNGRVLAYNMAELQEKSGLGLFLPSEAIQIFARNINTEGGVDISGFAQSINATMTVRGAQVSAEEYTALVRALFDMFDQDHNGVVDFKELSSGLSVLCAGSREEKILTAFRLYDTDGDGFISLEELTRYLVSVFRMLYATSAETRERMAVPPEELAVVTAGQCFEDADLNHDGKLSLDEFALWFNRPPAAPDDAGVPGSGEGKDDDDDAAYDEDGRPVWLDLAEARRVAKLGSIAPQDVFEEFAEAANEDGLIDHSNFIKTWFNIVNATGGFDGEEDYERAETLFDLLFDTFDENGDGFVDFSELSAGLTVLCGGDHQEKIHAAFDLFDYNGDGFISLEEMETYLTAVFKVLFETQPGAAAAAGVSAEELGEATAQQAFNDADLNHDGRLSRPEFELWYLKNNAGHKQEDKASEPLTLAEAKRLTCLDQFDVEDVFGEFAEAADETGVLERKAFVACFDNIIQSTGSLSRAEEASALSVIDRLFDLFDNDGNGVVDFSELASGLSVLCGGSRDDKARAAFSLFDYNGDGFITLEEMRRYLGSVFKVMYETQPGTGDAMGVSAEDLAAVTAQQAFEDADLNHDGRLSFEEFQKWYAQPAGQQVQTVVDSIPSWVSLKEVRRVTGLEQFDVEDVFEEFAVAANEDGVLDRQAFVGCFKSLLDEIGGHENEEEDPARFDIVLNRLFDLFDNDGNGVVDFSELASGLSVLCGGSRDDKARAAFSLFDYNGDGFITLEEMRRYLGSVFKVMYETQPGTGDAMGVSAEDLAAVTAQQAFEDADLNHDGRLSFEEFQKWYAQPAGQQVQTVVDSIPSWVSLKEVRRVTRLEQFDVDDVFEEFAVAANEDGVLDRQAFDACFSNFLERAGGYSEEEDSDKLNVVKSRLFEIFDVDGNGTVDFSELASGLSILCGGSRDDKARAAFSLFDYNGDGFISKKEMVRYLTSVFRVMYETQPGSRDKMGVDADVLARATAEQAFEDADLNHDGRLSFAEFQLWYGQAPGNSVSADVVKGANKFMSVAEFREVSGLEFESAEDVFEHFSSMASEDDSFDLKTFKQCLANYADPRDTRFDNMCSIIFGLFDTDGNGVVDFTELASGLTVLCGGKDHDKIRASFNLYDVNGDGFISLDEMVQYLHSVFKVMFAGHESMEETFGCTAEELAIATAKDAFEVADLNHDGRLSFDEFQKWYKKSGAGGESEEKLETPSAASDTSSEATTGVGPTRNLERVRELTKLSAFDANEVYEILSEMSPDGSLDKSMFLKCFRRIIQLGGGHNDAADEKEAADVVAALFSTFDTNGDGLVDSRELASGVSVLCAGYRDEKIRAAFSLFDTNDDGFISLIEMTTYLTSVFKVLFEANEGTKDSIGVSADELGKITAEQAFLDCDLNHDGRLSYDEFKKWYDSSGGGIL